ncbi:hypothetical protein [Neoroseomonas lacus]|uniref:Uncharacterized protein n=1 Tax=Neoroseomonas lacus TaxID=287609 RepID=A0A917KH77_9PROT|nr:hypothetical protein [Neoroseomonas lacus]GGJ14037.1 hypothetical protein GCM10011320_21630 [Neoroseomonas lacus]
MRNTVFAGQLVGWLAIVGGAIVVLIGLTADQTDIDWRMRAAMRAGLVAQGLSGAAAGVVFLLLAGILGTLLDLRDDARAAQARREAGARATARDVRQAVTAPTARQQPITRSPASWPASAPSNTGGHIGDPPKVAVPSRYDMMTRHGEALGAAAWELLSTAAKAGIALPEADAVRKVREGPRHD